MNRSLEIVFAADGTVFLSTEATVAGFAATIQNALVNLISERGRDTLFEDRGTQLLTRALTGVLVDGRAAAHEANFAAADTLFFSREFEVAATADKLADVQFEVGALSLLRLDLNVTFVAADGRVASFPITNPAA